tara:strand:+ start:93323 stop:93922 length:600 start_codon:yes stop_codon:yes gene_type:complete
MHNTLNFRQLCREVNQRSMCEVSNMNLKIVKMFGLQVLVTGLLVGVLQSANAQADGVLYLDNELTINDAIVMEGDKTRYYQQVRLAMEPNGDFRVVDAVEKQLAYVEELSVAVIETNPVEVELGIAGYKSTPCVELNTAVTRKGNTFFVVIGETPLQTLVACIQVTDPFEITLPLDVKGLSAGEYLVVVNGDEIDFTLD